MKKVLFVITALETGGAEKSLVNLLNCLDYNRYQVDLLLFKKMGAFLDQVPKEVNVIDAPDDIAQLYGAHGCGLSGFYRKCVRYAGGAVMKILCKNRPGVGHQLRWVYVYKHNIKPFTKEYDIAIAYMHLEPMYYVADKVKAKKKIGWVHIDYSALKSDEVRDNRLFAKFDHVVSISDECVNVLRRRFSNCADRFVMLPNLTSSVLTRKMAEIYSPEEYEEVRLSDMNKKILLSIGRLNSQKGFDYAIDAAKILRDMQISFMWYIIGQGELEASLMKQIQECGVQEYVKLLGVRSNPYPYMRGADVIVQPSRYEGKSVVLDEAKILCKQIVVSNYRTVVDQIIDGKEGVIVDMTPEGVAQGIKGLLDKPESGSSLVDYLKMHNYGNENEVEKYYEIME